MVLKIVGLGFVFEKHSYLRDPWNIIDFLIVASSWVTMFLSDTNLSVLRTLRVCRTLRTLTSFPQLSKLMEMLLSMLPEMTNISILFLTFVVVFACVTI